MQSFRQSLCFPGGSYCRRLSLGRPRRFRTASSGPQKKGAAALAASVAGPQVQDSDGLIFKLACPICQDNEFTVTQASGKPMQALLDCPKCARTFAVSKDYVDLTMASGMRSSSYVESWWLGTETFRRPFVSQVYELGWRQGFAWAGFPGVDKEFDMAMHYLQSAYGQTLVDMSCGSGLFTRRFALSGLFQKVIAADFSESMLQQTKELLTKERALDSGSVLLLRADVGRLPFKTASVAAIHAGAALHCWPNPTAALAEISRVLKPGGLFVGSTFLNGAAPLGQLIGNDRAVQALNALDPTRRLVSSQFRWWSEDDIRDLFASVGLINFDRHRDFRFILWTAQKPGASE